jgi:hypothetical protein
LIPVSIYLAPKFSNNNNNNHNNNITTTTTTTTQTTTPTTTTTTTIKTTTRKKTTTLHQQFGYLCLSSRSCVILSDLYKEHSQWNNDNREPRNRVNDDENCGD